MYPDSMAFYRQGGAINYFLRDYRGVVRDINKAFELGDYSVKSKFDSFNCVEILDMDDEESPHSYPSPPPMEVIKEK